MHKVIRLATIELARFLEEALSGVSSDWWQSRVLERLTCQQQRIAHERGYSQLRNLDFAALLRVFDQNWREISHDQSLPREGRNWLKEMQSVRNKWAHASSEDYSAKELYRDADTMVRFLQMLEASEDTLDVAERVQQDALSEVAAKMPRRSSNASASMREQSKPSRQSHVAHNVKGSTADSVEQPTDRGGLVPTYQLTLHKTYFNNGFFNLGVDVERFVTRTEGPITLFLGSRSNRLKGRVARSANSNGTPRIYGGAALRDWFLSNFQELDVVLVSIVSPEELLVEGVNPPRNKR